MPEHRDRIRLLTAHERQDNESHERVQRVELLERGETAWDATSSWGADDEDMETEFLEASVHDRLLAAIGVNRVVEAVRARIVRLEELYGEA